ncbi:MAG: tRNA modification GTPase MnmE [Lentisphaerae bacterium ADurb.BinA184]|nr:MAG: tRNA modification GTPase MnmE [Lentisphaerae bacterium ADurb.BinA184]
MTLSGQDVRRSPDETGYRMPMETAPKSLRLHIGLFGRANAGKSSFLNLVCSQDVAITSPLPGTTTDVVEKPMELLPIGPVVFLDTAGLSDPTALAEARLGKTARVFDRADIVVLVCEANVWGDEERAILDRAAERRLPVIAAVTKADLAAPDEAFLGELRGRCAGTVVCNATQPSERERVLAELKQHILAVCPEDFLRPPPLIGDLVRPGGLAVLLVPIDLEAPRGRLILPQVQAIRDALDHDAAVLVVKENGYASLLGRLGVRPDVVVCDSQVVRQMVAETPPDIPCTTFSILFARRNGDLPQMVRGAAAIDRLRAGDRVLIAESCSHHPLADDIGRVKIPRWLRQYTGVELAFDSVAGRDFPPDLPDYRLVVQCGGCMNNRREMLSRLGKAAAAGVPITNYGVCIAHTQGVLRRVLSPLPAALDAYESLAAGGAIPQTAQAATTPSSPLPA